MFRFSVRMSPIVPFEFNVTNDGFWGDTTATLDWCEGNYEVSREQGLLGDRETGHKNPPSSESFVSRLIPFSLCIGR